MNELQLLEAVMEALPVGFAITDREGGTLRWNQAFADLWGGRLPATASVRDYSEYKAWWSESGRALAPEEWASAQVLAAGRSVTGQLLEIERFDGSRAQVINSAAPIRNKAGRILGCAVAIQDITNLRQIEEALRAREADLSLIMEAVPALIAYIDKDGRYRRVNSQYADWFATTPQKIKGCHMGEVLGADQWNIIKPYVEQALSGETIAYERQLTLPGGDRRWIRASYTPDVKEVDRIQGFVVHVMDIEERKQIEEAVRASEEKYRRILETANEGIVIGNLDGKIAFLNQKWADMLGYDKEELVGRVGLDFMDEDQESLVLESRQRMQAGQKLTREYKFRRKDGSELWTLCSSSLFQDGAGKVSGYLAMHADITDRKLAEQARLQSEARFRLLSETAGALLVSASPQRVVEDICVRVMEHLDCQVFFNFLVGEAGGRLQLNAYAGIPEEAARQIEFLDFGVAVCGCAAMDRQRIVAENIFRTPDPRTELIKSYGVQAYACHPLMVGDHLLGTLSFGTKTRTAFTPEELEMMHAVADQVAAAMEKIRLLEEIRAARDQLDLRVRERTSELEAANRNLAEQSRLLESFFKDTITPLVLLDRDFNFIRVNEAYARACQRQSSDFPGHNHFELFPHAENEAIFRRVVETGIPYQALAKPFVYPEHPEWGVTFWDWVLTPLPDDQGRPAFLVFSLEEVTDRQTAEEALRQSERQLRSLADQLLYAQENERKRIARDMHDSLGASLSALKYKIEDLAHNLSDRHPAQIRETLNSLVPIIQETISETRRMQNDLRPPLLDDLGILPTLSWFSREFQKVYREVAIEQEWEVREEEVPDRLRVVIFRLTQETLNNVGKHARATRVRIYLGREGDRLKLEILDNGVGFDPLEPRETTDPSRGMGLSSMQERAELSEGLFSLETRPGQGTTIRVTWPLAESDGRQKK